MNATMQATRFWIEIIAALTIALAIGATMYQRFQQGSGPVSIRTIQLLAIAVLAPLILILGLERVLEPSAVGALIGALLGYLLSGIGNEKA
jgi:drug/metabolite transporter (DMT)-like permease